MFFTKNYDKYNTSEMKDKAMQYLFIDKIQNPLRGKYMAKELEFKDNETDLIRRTDGRQMVSGSCFTFMYNNRNVLEIDGRDKFYMDVVPLVFVLDPFFRNEYSMCVNFNTLHPKQRCFVLDLMISLDPHFYENFYSSEDPVSWKAIGNMVVNIDRIIEILHDYKIPMNVYKNKYIKTIRYIEPYNLIYIPYLDFEDSLRGIKLKEIQYKNLGLAKILKDE